MQDKMRAVIAGHIQSFGQHLVSVHSAVGEPIGLQPFIYTIGNHGVGLPELLLVGTPGDTGMRILNILGEMQRGRGSPFLHGETVDFTAKYPALICDGGQLGRDEYAVQAGVYYHTEEFEVRQVLLCDQNGHYPGDPRCLPPYSGQLILTRTH